MPAHVRGIRHQRRRPQLALGIWEAEYRQASVKFRRSERTLFLRQLGRCAGGVCNCLATPNMPVGDSHRGSECRDSEPVDWCGCVLSAIHGGDFVATAEIVMSSASGLDKGSRRSPGLEEVRLAEY